LRRGKKEKESLFPREEEGKIENTKQRAFARPGLFLPVLLVAVPAVDRPTLGWLEGDFTFLAAV
jgi:hypothetical protein